MQCCFVSSHREMINFSAANAVAHIRVIHPFLCLNKPSSIKWPHPSQAPNLAHSRHLSSLSVWFGLVISVLLKVCLSFRFQDFRLEWLYNSLLIRNMSLGHGSLILLSLSVFFLLFIIRHDTVLSGLFLKKSLFGGISESQALGVFVILSLPPILFIFASAVINSASLLSFVLLFFLRFLGMSLVCLL